MYMDMHVPNILYVFIHNNMHVLVGVCVGGIFQWLGNIQSSCHVYLCVYRLHHAVQRLGGNDFIHFVCCM